MRFFLTEHRMLILSVSAVFFAVMLLDIFFKAARHKSRRKEESRRRNYGYGELIYAGQTGGLLSYKFGDACLFGRPDLVMRDKETNEVFVVDLKSGKAPAVMEKHHALQLAAYFLMVESCLGTAPVTRGIIRYLDDGNKEHAIENSSQLKQELLGRIKAITEAKKEIKKGVTPRLARNHNIRHRCNACEFRAGCAQPL